MALSQIGAGWIVAASLKNKDAVGGCVPDCFNARVEVDPASLLIIVPILGDFQSHQVEERFIIPPSWSTKVDPSRPTVQASPQKERT